MQLTITGYSTALFSTWYFIDELGILFDAGDGITAGLLQKSRKINHVFISHADRDHITGLLQFNQLNARPGGPVIYYPENSGSFPAMEGFFKNFDPHATGTVWVPVTAESEIRIKDDIIVTTVPNSHVPAAESITKSLGYKVEKVKRKLKPALAHLTGPEIKQYAELHGKDSTTMEVRTNIISYSGDTPVEDPARWNDTNILIHEATFLTGKEEAAVSGHQEKHSTLEEVIEMVSGSNVQQLVLGHFSSRYSAAEIEAAVKQLCGKYALNIPVYCVLPGEVKRDILKGERVNK
jgi:ribonuclease Z